MKFKFLFVLLFSQSLWAQTQNLEVLSQKIRNAGAEWEAGETEVGRLSDAQKAALLDKKIDPNPGIVFSSPEDMQVMATSSLDWRNKDGKNWLSPILNQGSCGSCVAFAATATMEAQYRISLNLPTSTISLSRAFLFSCGGGKCNAGWYPDSAAQFLMKTGVVDEACMRYTAGSGRDQQCSKACTGSQRKIRKISSYSRPTQNVLKIEQVKAALKRGPLSTRMSVFKDFFNYKRGIYKHVSGAYAGGHAVVIVGYNDQQRYFVIQNSWGKSWGESGFAKISYDDVVTGLATDTWKYEVSSSVKSAPELSPMSLSQVSAPRAIASAYQDAPQTLHLSRSIQFKNVSENEVVQLTLEAGELANFETLQFVKHRYGSAPKKINAETSGSVLTVNINTALLKRGEWEFYFEGVQTVNGHKRLVRSERVSYSAK